MIYGRGLPGSAVAETASLGDEIIKAAGIARECGFFGVSINFSEVFRRRSVFVSKYVYFV